MKKVISIKLINEGHNKVQLVDKNRKSNKGEGNLLGTLEEYLVLFLSLLEETLDDNDLLGDNHKHNILHHQSIFCRGYLDFYEMYYPQQS